MLSPSDYINECYTSLNGTTFEGRQGIIAKAREHDIRRLYLVREPTNRYDRNAVQVCAKSPNGTMVMLGYIKNREIECVVCGHRGTLRPGEAFPEICPACSSTDISREGLATRLAIALDNGVKYFVEVSQYTGGDLDDSGKKKTLGVNIKITRDTSVEIGQ